jgi:hypothetical protein
VVARGSGTAGDVLAQDQVWFRHCAASNLFNYARYSDREFCNAAFCETNFGHESEHVNTNRHNFLYFL